MSLFDPQVDARAALHGYLSLLARVEDPARPAQSTLVRKLRNELPHGGGRRLGGPGDCLDQLLISWLEGRPVRACPPPPAPSFERFVAEVQPVLDQMTCTRSACHGHDLLTWRLTPHAADPKALQANYRETVREIDFDFPPMSEVMLRMREPCAYQVVGAWIDGRPRPDCTVHDPDPSIFPRIDGK
jgi:hypothetical protein